MDSDKIKYEGNGITDQSFEFNGITDQSSVSME